MSISVVGAVREWLETVPDYSGKPASGVARTLEDGLTPVERLTLMIYADFEQRNVTNPSLDRIARGIGRSRRQAIRIVELLRDDLKLLRLSQHAAQHQANSYRITIPGVTSDDTPEQVPGVTLATARGDIRALSGDTQMSPELRERKRTSRAMALTAPRADRKPTRWCPYGNEHHNAIPCVDCSRDQNRLRLPAPDTSVEQPETDETPARRAS